MISILIGCSVSVNAHTWWVGFTDKAGTAATLDNPSVYLSERALQRRERQGIAIDSTDLPVSQVYIETLKDMGCDILFTSRWNNGATVSFPDSATLLALRRLAFVDTVELTQRTTPAISPKRRQKLPQQTKTTDYGATADQIRQIGLDRLHEAGFTGQGIHLAVIDNGFYRCNEIAAFNNIREQILLTKDFVQAGNDVYRQGTHGTHVFSTIAGTIDGEFYGTAPQASYYLLRTEDDDTESPREIDAQVAAFELADSLGADIITTSLGYGIGFDDAAMDIPYSALDGKTLRNSKAATMAARKGIIVCASMGNDGNNEWYYLTSPADADSILSVGAVDRGGNPSIFTSHGPTADNRVKPEVCALGTETVIINASYGSAARANGTSFSTPIIAGMAACLWSALPELNNMQIIDRIVRHTSQYRTPDTSVGYGIPNAWQAYTDSDTALENTAQPQWQEGDIWHIYTLQGQLLNIPYHLLPKGVYVVRSKDGCRKIVK